MTTGTIPASCRACPPSRKRKSSQRRQRQQRPLPLQQQQQQPPQAAETRCWFTEEELAKIQKQLDKLLPYSNCSSKTISPISALVCMFAYCRMLLCLLSHSQFFVPYRPRVIHQLNIQLSDDREGQPQSSEDTLEIKLLSAVHT